MYNRKRVDKGKTAMRNISSTLHLSKNIIANEKVHNRKHFFMSKNKIHHTHSPQKDMTAINPSQFRCSSLLRPHKKETLNHTSHQLFCPTVNSRDSTKQWSEYKPV